MPEWRFDLDRHVIDDLGFDDETIELLEDVGDQVADIARGLAPKRTGAGASSIHGEIASDGDSSYVDVSWSDEQFHMGYQELGTEKMPPHPFLRPALDRAQI